jgi:hypothetical protein
MLPFKVVEIIEIKMAKIKKSTVIEFIFRGKEHVNTSVCFKGVTQAKLWREFNAELFKSKLEQPKDPQTMKIQVSVYERIGRTKSKQRTRTIYGLTPTELRTFTKLNISEEQC